MKRVLVAKDDAASISDEGGRVNGELLPHSAPIQADWNGRPHPRFPAALHAGWFRVAVMSEVSSMSFDGRHFGPIHCSKVKGVNRAVFTW